MLHARGRQRVPRVSAARDVALLALMLLLRVARAADVGKPPKPPPPTAAGLSRPGAPRTSAASSTAHAARRPRRACPRPSRSLSPTRPSSQVASTRRGRRTFAAGPSPRSAARSKCGSGRTARASTSSSQTWRSWRAPGGRSFSHRSGTRSCRCGGGLVEAGSSSSTCLAPRPHPRQSTAVPGNGCAGSFSVDFDWTGPEGAAPQQWAGRTRLQSDDGQRPNVSVVLDPLPAGGVLELSPSSPTARFIAAIATSIDEEFPGGSGSAADVAALAASSYAAAAALSTTVLWAEHTAAWAVLNAAGIDVEPASADPGDVARAADVASHARSSQARSVHSRVSMFSPIWLVAYCRSTFYFRPCVMTTFLASHPEAVSGLAIPRCFAGACLHRCIPPIHSFDGELPGRRLHGCRLLDGMMPWLRAFFIRTVLRMPFSFFQEPPLYFLAPALAASVLAVSSSCSCACNGCIEICPCTSAAVPLPVSTCGTPPCLDVRL